MGFKIGVMVDSFRLDTINGIKKSKEVGANGIQIYATRGAFEPEQLTSSDRKELLDVIKSNGLVVSALCGDMGGHGFSKREDNLQRIEKSKRIVDLANDLETNVVTTHIGVIPRDKNHERFSIFQDALGELGLYAAKTGTTFAIETGPEDADTLKMFIDSLDKGVGVNLDPANFVMVTDQDPVEAVYKLKDYIVHTHAKDGIMRKKADPEFIYTSFSDKNMDVQYSDYFLETALGDGQVDFDAYLNALTDINYNGFLTIEREVGENPYNDIVKAVNFLKEKI